MTDRRLVQLGIGLLAAAVLGTAWLLWVSTSPSAPTTDSLPEESHLSSRLPPDEVAVVVRETGPVGIASVARVGDRIDVLGYFSGQGSSSEPATRLLLRNVIVYGVGRGGDAGALTVGVTPEGARIVQQTSQSGARIIITLRSGQGDASRPQPETLTDSDLLTWLRRQ